MAGDLDDVLEPLISHYLGREAGGKDFDHDATTERGLDGHEYARHASASELTFEGVGAAELRLEPFAHVGHCD